MTFFDRSITVRMTNLEREQIEHVIRIAVTSDHVGGGYRFEGLSHFVRCAVIKMLHEEMKKLDKVKK